MTTNGGASYRHGPDLFPAPSVDCAGRRGAAAPARRLKILALHGLRQNGEVFRARARKMRRALDDLAEFTFVTSPLRYEPRGAARAAMLDALVDLGFTKATVAVGEVGNFVGDRGAAALAAMLTRNTALRALDLLHNSISQAGVNDLLEALRVNRTLTSLQLTQFGRAHGEPSKAALRAALARNRALVPAGEAEAVAKLEMPDHVAEIYSVYRTHA